MLSLTTRINSRTTSLTNLILLNLRRQISTDSTPISVETSVPFTAHNCEVPSRTVSSKLLDFFRTMSPMRRAEIAADSLYNWNLVRGYEHDPVERVRKLLSFHDAGTEKELKDIEKEMRKEMDQVTSKAKVAGQRFMCIKTDNLHMASPLPVFMNSHQPMLKATYAHFSSTAESQKVPLSGNKHLRPLSPHLSVYKPQSSSMFSIFNRMSAAMLTVIVLSFTLLTMKMGYICLSYAYFYQLLFYLSKLIPISMDISALALAYHLFHSGYLVLKRMK